MKKKSVIEIDSSEVEDLAEKHLSLGSNEYSFVAIQECGNDSSHQFDVDLPDRNNDWVLEDIEQIEDRKYVPTYRNDLVLSLLCEKGILEPGEYIVNVCW